MMQTPAQTHDSFLSPTLDLGALVEAPGGNGLAMAHGALDAGLLLGGDYQRLGDDLVLRGPDGTTEVIAGYFRGPAQDLVAVNGAKVHGETVLALVGGEAAGEPLQIAGLFDRLKGLVGGGAETIGRVVFAQGLVRAKGEDGEARVLESGDPVYEGDVLETGKGSVSLRFTDGTHFQLGANARAVLDEYVYQPEAGEGSFAATALIGVFRYVSGKIAELQTGRHSTIKTPTATIGIRGSELDGEVAADGTTTVVHTSGILDIADVDGMGLVTLLETDTATVVGPDAAPLQAFQAPPSLRERFSESLPPRPVGPEDDAQPDADGSGDAPQDAGGTNIDTLNSPDNPDQAPDLVGSGAGQGEQEGQDDGQEDSQGDGGGTGDGDPGSGESAAVQGDGGEQDPGTAPELLNNLPTAVADAYTVSEESPGSGNVLANDTDADGDPLTVVAAQPVSAAGAAVAMAADGSFTYDPRGVAALEVLDTGQVRIDRFTYTVADDRGGEAEGLVEVAVTGVNDPPVTSAVPPLEMSEDDAPTTIDLAPYFADPEEGTEALTYTIEGNTGAGFLAAELGSPLLTLTSLSDRGGEAVITVRGTDRSGLFAEVDLQVTVTEGENALPVPTDDTATGDARTPLTLAVLSNDTDPDADPLTVTEAVSAAGATVVVNPDGTLGYDPAGLFDDLADGETATDTVTYTVSDGSGEEPVTSTVTVTVTGVNDPPVAVADAAESDEDTPVTVDVLANDTDADGDPLTLTGAVSAAGAGVVVTAAGAIEYDPAGTFDSLLPGETAIDEVTYLVADGSESVEGTLTVTVSGVNDAPVVVSPIAGQEVDENGTLASVSLSGVFDDVDDGLAGLDFSASSSNASLVTASVSGSTLSLSLVPDAFGSATVTVTARDAAGATASESFSVVVNEVAATGAESVLLRMTSTPFDGDLILLDAQGNENLLSFYEEFTYQDVLDGRVIYRHDGAPYDGAADSLFLDVATVDGGRDSASLSIGVLASADPVLTLDPAQVAFGVDQSVVIDTAVLDATDADSPLTDLVFQLFDSPQAGALKLDGQPLGYGGTFTYDDLQSGALAYVHNGDPFADSTESLFFQVHDGAGGSSSGSLQIDVQTSQAPTLSASPLPVGFGGIVELNSGDLLVEDADSPLGDVELRVAHTPFYGSLLVDGIAIGFGDTFTYTELTGGLVAYEHLGDPFTGAFDDFSLEVADGAGGLSFATLDVEIAVSAAPNVNAASASVAFAGSVELSTEDLDISDPDNPPPADLLIEIDGTPGEGVLTLNGFPLGFGDSFTYEDVQNSLVEYAHDGGFAFGNDSFFFDVTDGAGGWDSSFFSVDVTRGPAPSVSGFGATVALSAEIVLTDADLSGTDLVADTQFRLEDFAQIGTLELGGVPLSFNQVFTYQDLIDGQVSFQHDGDIFGAGSESLSLRLLNPDGGTSTTNLTIDVAGSAAPTLDATGTTVAFGGSTTLTPTGFGVSDPDSALADLVFKLSETPSYGQLSNGAESLFSGSTFSYTDLEAGQITYQHDGDPFSPWDHSFSFQVADGAGGVASGNFLIDVLAGPDPTVTTSPVEVAFGGEAPVDGTAVEIGGVQTLATLAVAADEIFDFDPGTGTVDGQDSVDGGAGIDTLAALGDGTIPLDGLGSFTATGIEIVDLRNGGAANELALDIEQVFDIVDGPDVFLADGTRQLLVLGDGADSIGFTGTSAGSLSFGAPGSVASSDFSATAQTALGSLDAASAYTPVTFGSNQVLVQDGLDAVAVV